MVARVSPFAGNRQTGNEVNAVHGKGETTGCHQFA